MTCRISIFQAGDIKRALSRIDGQRFAWLYLGQDVRQRARISQVLGKGNRYFLGGLLQEIAYQEKQPFLDFISELGTVQKNRLNWWATNTAYRTPLVNTLFLLWCYAALFGKVCSQSRQDSERLLLVFVADRWLYRHLWQRYQDEADFCFLSRKSVFPEMVKLAVKGIAGRGYFFMRTVYLIWQLRYVVRASPHTPREAGKGVYIYSWIQDRFFPENGVFLDAYFGKLPEILAGEGAGINYITPPFLPAALKRKCLNHARYGFIFLEQYVSFGDILQSLFRFSPISYNIGQRRLRTLLWRQTMYEISPLCSHILYYFAFKRWLKEIDQRETIIIYPFENQPWEKLLCMAAKEHGKNIKLIGYQHSTIPLMELSYFLGTGESRIMPLPHLIVTSGEYTLGLLEKAGYGAVKLVNGGALRYDHLREARRELVKREGEPRTVLVVLPYSRHLAHELLIDFLDAFGGSAPEGVKFMIKLHPAVPAESLGMRRLNWPAYLEPTDKPLSEMLAGVDLVVYSSSSAGLEALLSGVPVVRYYSEHVLSSDPLDAFAESTVKSCSGDQLRQAVLSAINDSGKNLLSHSAFDITSLNKLFSPVDEEVWRQAIRS